MMTSIPAWGLFVIIISKLWLDWSRDREAAKAPDVPTEQEIAAVVRDQQERKEILDLLRGSHESIDRVTETMSAVAQAQKQIAEGQERLAEVIGKIMIDLHNNRTSIEKVREDTRILRELVGANQSPR